MVGETRQPPAGHRGKRDQSHNVVAAHSMHTEAGFSKTTGKFQKGANEHQAWGKSLGLPFQHVQGRPFSISLSCPGSPLRIPLLENFLPGPLSLPGSEDGPGADVSSRQQPSLSQAATSLDKCSHGEIALVAWGQQREESRKSQVEATVGRVRTALH